MAGAIMIENGIYWVGDYEMKEGLHCNPYLIIDGEEAVLIDPGSVLDFEQVYENVTSLVPLEKVKYVILHHQDPDFCSSVPLFEKAGANFQIITHWRAAELIRFYGTQSKYYIVNEHEFRLTLESGRILGFIQTPYLHFPGAITTYDYKSKILFSSDLFGAFSYQWSLYADDNYIEKMKTFHEHYMPSNEIIRPVMEVFLAMDISMIAPQHGSIIKNRIPQHIKVLRDLECGAFLTPIRKNISYSGGYQEISGLVLRRYAAIFGNDEVLEVMDGLDITLDKEELEIIDYNYRGIELWNQIFEHILIKKGMNWLILLEPMVLTLCKDYDIPIPKIYQNTLIKAKQEATSLSKENAELKEINTKLTSVIMETQEQLVKCPVTGLYNYTFFKTYLTNSIRELMIGESVLKPALLIINVDNMMKIKFTYGDDEVDSVLKNMVYIMSGVLQENMMLFRLQGASFGCYIPNISKEQAVAYADKLRSGISSSEKFIEKITVSIGIVGIDEIQDKINTEEEIAKLLYDTALLRVKLAKKYGMNIVSSNSSEDILTNDSGKILIVDTDYVNVDLLKTVLENLNYKVFIACDGEEALQISEKEVPALIISEIMLPKYDAFQVRRKLLSQSLTKGIPFIIVSHLKNEDVLQQAAALGIEHFLKKPYMLSELIGIIQIKVKGDTYESSY